MLDKIKDWYDNNETDIEFAYVATVIASVLYALVWSLNYIFVTFLSFTGLKWIILAWMGWSVGSVISLWRKEEKLGEKDEY